MRFGGLSSGLVLVLLGATVAQAQNTAGSGGKGGNAVVNIYGGNIYLSPKAGDGGGGGSVKGGGSSSSPATGSPAASIWNHNGSTMELRADGARRRFLYVQPRPGVRAAGAESGTVLFDGTRKGVAYSGVAYVFAGKCGNFPYQVSGSLTSETEVVMTGMAPSVTRSTCSIDGYREDRLVFDYLQAQ